jgi:hypothetical protein
MAQGRQRPWIPAVAGDEVAGGRGGSDPGFRRWPAMRWPRAGARVRRRSGEPNLGIGEGRGSPEYAVRDGVWLGEGDRWRWRGMVVEAAGSGSVEHQGDDEVLEEVSPGPGNDRGRVLPSRCPRGVGGS